METLSKKEQESAFKGNLINVNHQLYYYALQLTENQDDARDLVQETNFKALKNYNKLKTTAHRNAWLYTILKNTHINNLRSGHSRALRNSGSDIDVNTLKTNSPQTDNPDIIFDRKELKEKIRSLPPTYSKPLKLLLAGYSYKEIAKMTEVPIGTVKSRIHIAKDKLKRKYIKYS